MKKIFLVSALLALMLCILTACGCDHEVWNDADCTTPKTCESCGETEGEPAGHDWHDADCDSPKTCTVCGETEGEPAAHIWQEAACEIPKTCTACGKTEGEPAGHVWLDATTEAPSTCEICGLTEGERIVTDARFTTDANRLFFGVWEGVLNVPASSLDMGIDGVKANVDLYYRVEFFPDGTMTVERKPVDADEFVRVMVASEVEYVYLRFEWDGYSRGEADAAIKKTYDMTMEEYVAEQMGLVDVEELFRDRVETYVYYADGENLYRASGWDRKMTPNPFAWENGNLLLSLDGGEMAPLTKTE